MNDICVLGLGYIGLPTACLFASHGFRVYGVDINTHIVKLLNAGKIHIEEVDLKNLFNETLKSGNLVIQETPHSADVFIIAVPTPIYPDKTADMRAVIGATENIVPYIRPGNLVILESTSPPGTTRDLVQPILERSGLKSGKDFKLVYSPERVLPGKILKEMVENARVVGGIDQVSAKAGCALYATFVKGEIILTDTTTAEMVKLMENTYRDVNIALANEFALIAEKLEVNVWEAIDIANHHPRVKILRPGPGVGGHCIAVDPWFLVQSAPVQARLIHQSRVVNDEMPEHVVEMVMRSVSNGAIVAILGVTYKANVDDTRESPALEIIRRLIASGIVVRTFDPHVHDLPEIADYSVKSVDEAVLGADLTVILVDHSEFMQIRPDKFITMRGRVVIDTRNCLDLTNWRYSGFSIVRIGAPQLEFNGTNY